MTYEPLHHKYRPQTFAQLVGQEAIATTLSNALRQQRIAPAYLFTGARGTGKTSSARIFAKSLNCLSGDRPTESPCGVCDACREVAKGMPPGVYEIDAASNTGVDNVRDLIEKAGNAPIRRYKVYLIDEVHMLSTAAFNALLKTLEEPPNHVVFILATTDPQRVLPTIISRCQRFDFRRIPLEAMIGHLESIAAQEQIDIAPEALQLVAQISQGGLRDAESLLDQLSLLEGQVTIDRVWDLVGAVPERDLLELLKAIAQNDPAAALDRVRWLMDRGREPLIVLQNLAGFYRDLLIAKTAPDRGDLVSITPSTWVELCQFVQDFDLGWILLGQRQLRASELQVKNTTQPRLWLEVALLGLLPSNTQSLVTAGQAIVAAPTISPTSTPSTTSQSTYVPVLAHQNRPQPSAFNPVSPPEAPAQKATIQSLPVTQSLPEAIEPAMPTHETAASAEPFAEKQFEFKQLWQQVIEHLHPLSKGLLRDHGRLVKFVEQQALIEISAPKLLKIAQSKISDIESAFKKVLDLQVKVSLSVADVSEAVVPAAAGNDAPVLTMPPVAQPTASPELERSPTAAAPATPPPELPKPIEPSNQQGWQEEDTVTRAAKSFAQMFNGQIVNLDDEISPSPDPLSQASLESAAGKQDLVPEPEDLDDEDDGEEMPF